MSVGRIHRSDELPSEPIVGSSPAKPLPRECVSDVSGPLDTITPDEYSSVSHDGTTTQPEVCVPRGATVTDALYGHAVCLHAAVCDCLLEHFYSSAAVVFAESLATSLGTTTGLSSSTRSVHQQQARATPRNQVGTLSRSDRSSSRTQSPFARLGVSSPPVHLHANAGAAHAGSSQRGSSAGRRATPGPRSTSATPVPPPSVHLLTTERRRCDERREALLRGGVEIGGTASRDDVAASNADLISVSTSERHAHHVGGSSVTSSSRASASKKRDGLSVLYSAPVPHTRSVAQQRSPIARRTSPVRSTTSATRSSAAGQGEASAASAVDAGVGSTQHATAAPRPVSAHRRDPSPVSRQFHAPVLRTASRSRTSPLRSEASTSEAAAASGSLEGAGLASATGGTAPSRGSAAVRSPSAANRRDSLADRHQRRGSSNTARSLSSSAPRRPSPTVFSGRPLRPLSPQKQAAQLLSTSDIFSRSAELRKQLKSVPMRSYSLPRVAHLASAATQRAGLGERVATDSARRSSSTPHQTAAAAAALDSPRTQPNTARRSSSGTGVSCRNPSPRHQQQQQHRPPSPSDPRHPPPAHPVKVTPRTAGTTSNGVAAGRSSSASSTVVVSAGDYAEQVLRCHVNRSLEVDVVLAPTKTGLQVNDLILELDGKSMSTLESLRTHFDQLYHSNASHSQSHRSSSSSTAAAAGAATSLPAAFVSVSVLRGTEFLVVDVPLPAESTLLLSGPSAAAAMRDGKVATSRDGEGRSSDALRKSSASAHQPGGTSSDAVSDSTCKEEIQVE